MTKETLKQFEQENEQVRQLLEEMQKLRAENERLKVQNKLPDWEQASNALINQIDLLLNMKNCNQLSPLQPILTLSPFCANQINFLGACGKLGNSELNQALGKRLSHVRYLYVDGLGLKYLPSAFLRVPYLFCQNNQLQGKIVFTGKYLNASCNQLSGVSASDASQVIISYNQLQGLVNFPKVSYLQMVGNKVDKYFAENLVINTPEAKHLVVSDGNNIGEIIVGETLFGSLAQDPSQNYEQLTPSHKLGSITGSIIINNSTSLGGKLPYLTKAKEGQRVKTSTKPISSSPLDQSTDKQIY